jgi:hypothetical protein
VMKVWKWRLAIWIENVISLTLIEEKVVSSNEAAKEETVILAQQTGFQEVSEDAIVELPGCRFVILTKEEPARLDRRTYKGGQYFHGDYKSVTSEENTLTIKRFKGNFQKN